MRRCVEQAYQSFKAPVELCKDGDLRKVKGKVDGAVEGKKEWWECVREEGKMEGRVERKKER